VTNNSVHDAVLLGRGYGQAISLIADGFVVSDNTVFNNVTEGIDMWLGAKHGEVSRNTVYGNGAAGIYVDGSSYVRVAGNRVYGNARGIGVASEDVNYATHDVWVYNNVAYDNAGAGVFVWDSSSNPGYHGSQNVVLANNTLVNNQIGVYLAGDANTATILNNLGYNNKSNIYDSSTGSSYSFSANLWVKSPSVFVSPATGDFRLTTSSPAIDAGVSIPSFSDDLGNVYTVLVDLLGASRTVNGRTDVGAYEYQ
jgi:parallel beta-helix repeat protein